MKLNFTLENNKISIQYRKFMISFIKNALQNYNEKLYQELYTKGKNTKKTFCFSVILPKPTFKEDTIDLSNPNFQVIFSFYDYAYAIHFYNAFMSEKFKKFSLYQNAMTLTNIIILPERKIESNSILVKMSSPLVVREHNKETLKDWYHSFEKEPGFSKWLKINILEQMQGEGLDASLLENFEIEAVQAKKTVVKCYEYQIECSLGFFKLKGNKKLLNYLYKAGIGARKAMGFGLFDVL